MTAGSFRSWDKEAHGQQIGRPTISTNATTFLLFQGVLFLTSVNGDFCLTQIEQSKEKLSWSSSSRATHPVLFSDIVTDHGRQRLMI